MADRRPGIVAALLAAACILSFGAFSASAASRYRVLERLLEDTAFSAAEYEQVAKSFSAAVKAGQDRGDIADLVESCLEGEFTAAQVVRVLKLSAQLELSGLPAESFFLKVQEGVAKGVEAARVVGAAERQALMLKKSDNILNGLLLQGVEIDDPEELLPAVAEALGSGRSEREVREIIIKSSAEGESQRKLSRRLLR